MDRGTYKRIAVTTGRHYGKGNMLSGEKIKVSKIVQDSILCVRNSGLTNMFDMPEVCKIGIDQNMDEMVVWIIQNRGLYVRGLIQGFEIEEEAK